MSVVGISDLKSKITIHCRIHATPRINPRISGILNLHPWSWIFIAEICLFRIEGKAVAVCTHYCAVDLSNRAVSITSCTAPSVSNLTWSDTSVQSASPCFGGGGRGVQKSAKIDDTDNFINLSFFREGVDLCIWTKICPCLDTNTLTPSSN